MATGNSLTGSVKVRKLQTVPHAKAKEEPDRRFHALIDKVRRTDFLMEAWARVRRNGGSAGVDGETSEGIEPSGPERWPGELSRELREGTCRPKPVRQVLIPEKQPGGFRPLGIPCIRDRVARTSAMPVPEPVFGADLQPERYAYRPGRGAKDAVRRVHSLLDTGHNEVVDCDLSNHFGGIPHAGLMRSVARRVSDGRMPGLIKAWLEMPVEEDDGEGGKRRTDRARRQRKGTPQGSPVSVLLSNLHMRRFIPGWKLSGHTRRFRSEIVNYADDICVPGKAPAAEMLSVVRRIMDRLKLPVNERKTRCLRCPEEPIGFPGYRIGRNHRTEGRGPYIGTRPGKAGVQGICRRVSEQTAGRNALIPAEVMVKRLNRIPSGWAECCDPGQVSPACKSVDAHAARRLRRWLCRKRRVRTGKSARFPDEVLWNDCGLIRPASRTKSLPWAKA